MRLLAPSGERVSLAQLTKIGYHRRGRRDLSRGRINATSPSNTACVAAISAVPVEEAITEGA